MDLYLITKHQINKANIYKTADTNRQNYNCCHVIHHINVLNKQTKKNIIIPIDPKNYLVVGGGPISIPGMLSQETQNKMNFPQSVQKHL